MNNNRPMVTQEYSVQEQVSVTTLAQLHERQDGLVMCMLGHYEAIEAARVLGDTRNLARLDAKTEWLKEELFDMWRVSEALREAAIACHAERDDPFPVSLAMIRRILRDLRPADRGGERLTRDA